MLAMPNINFNVPGIEKLVNNLNPRRHPGPTSYLQESLRWFPVKYPQHCVPSTYQQSYDTGQVPIDWRNITAFFNKGDKINPANYSPVSLTCILCKTMEHVVFSQTINHLDDYDILVHFLHGFRPNHSCETQRLTTVENLSHRLDKRKTPSSLSSTSTQCLTDAFCTS